MCPSGLRILLIAGFGLEAIVHLAVLAALWRVRLGH
jgi:hypothetical protein